MARIKAATPQQYVYRVQAATVTEYVLVRENANSFLVKPRFENSRYNVNIVKNAVLFRSQWAWRYGSNNFTGALRNKEQAMILCMMAFGHCVFIKSKWRKNSGT